MRTITIDPITRLEGHGKIEVFLDDTGTVSNAYLQIPELRGFEKFCEGRPVEELPRITAKICGVCPEAHHLAATKALDAVYRVQPPPAAKKLRELYYCAHIIHSHIAHFFALAAPDFVVGPDAPAAERNIIGLIAKVGREIGLSVIAHRSYAQQIQQTIGGRATYPVCGLPGGMSKAITEEERKEIADKADLLVQFAQFSLTLFNETVVKSPESAQLVLSQDLYYLPSHYMGTVDADNRVNFYDGDLRVVTAEGEEFTRFAPADYLDHIAEHVESWSYMKFAYLKKLGWPGLGESSSRNLVRVGPLARLNVADGMATPLAQAEYDRMYATLGAKPVHHTLAFHWARLIEMLYCAERLQELAGDPEVASPDVRALPREVPTEGVGIVEAPRGTLIHHFRTDGEGLVRGVNLVVATGLNYAAICGSITKIAKALIANGHVTDGILNRVEMAFRAYDPCMSCASHTLPGRLALSLNIRNSRGEIVENIRNE